MKAKHKEVKKYLNIVMMLGTLFAISSCVPSDFEFPKYQTELYLPILDVKLGLDDIMLIDTAEVLQEDTTGLVTLIYSMTEVQSFEEAFSIDDQLLDFTIPGIPSEMPDFNIEIPLDVELLGIATGDYMVFPPYSFNYDTIVNIDELNYAEFKRGFVGLEITNNLPLTLKTGALIEFINTGDSEAVYSFLLNKDIEPLEHFVFKNADLSNKLITGSFTFRIKNFSIAEGNNIHIKEDDNLNISISFKDIAYRKASFAVPDIELPSLALNIPIVNTVGAKLKNAKLDNGTLSIEIPELNSALKLKLTFPSATQNGETLSVVLGDNNTSISLHDLSIDLSTKLPEYNILPVTFQLVFDQSEDEVLIEFEKPLEGKVELLDVDYDYLKGYLGTTIDILEESETLNLYQRIVSGTLAFANPQIKISVINGTGIAAKFFDDGNGLYISGSNERLYGEKTVKFGNSLDGFSLMPAPNPGEISTSTILINEDTDPNFSEFMSLFPTYMEMRIPVKMGTDEEDFNQLIDDDATVGITVDLDLPLNLSADRFTITDTSDFSIQFDPEKFEVKSGIFEAKVESNFPITLHIQNYFLDGNKEVIDSLFDSAKLIDPAIIDDDGNIIESAYYEYSIEVDKETMYRLQNTVYMVSNIKLQTQDSKFVKLYSSNNIQYKLIGLVTTDIDMNK